MSWTNPWDIVEGDGKKSAKEIRSFAAVVGGVFCVLGLLILWRGKRLLTGKIFLVVAGTLAIVGLIYPPALRPIERAWMGIAEIMSRVMTAVVVTLVFYLMVTPVGLLRRLFIKDPMQLRIDRQSKSYWSKVDPAGPASRPFSPF